MLEERLLIWKLKRGSTDALARIYQRYECYLLTLAANLLNDTAGAEDAVQDVFVGFARSIEKFRLSGSLKGYLATCVANRCRDYLRKRQRRQTVTINNAEQIASDAKGAIHLVIRSEELQQLGHAMGRLPYEQREVIVLHLHGELKFRQIAEFQNVSIKTAQSRYRYGLDKLRSLLDGEVEK